MGDFEKQSTSNGAVHSESNEASLLIRKPEEKLKSNGKWTREQWISIIIICSGNFFAGNCVSLQGPFFPREAELKGASPTAYGFVFAVYQVSVFIASPISAKMLAVLSPTFILNSGQFILGTTTILFGLINKAPSGTPFLSLAFVIRAMEGLGAAAYSTSSFSLIVSQFPDKVATTFATVQMIFGVGLIAGPTVGGALYQLGGFILPFVTIGLCVFVCCIFSIFLIQPPETKTVEKRKGLLKFWMNPLCFMVSACIICNFINIGYNSAVLEPHLRQFNLSPVMVGGVFIISAGVYSITSPFCGRICDKLEYPEFLCMPGITLQCIYLLLIGPAPFFPLETELWLVILSMIIFGFGISGVLVPGFSAVLKETLRKGFPNDLSTYALVSSLFYSSLSLGSFIGPSVGGFLEDIVGYRNGTVVLFGINCFVFVIFVAFLFWRKKQITKERKEKDCEKLPNQDLYEPL